MRRNKQLAARMAEIARERAGQKITRMGARRKDAVRQTVAAAMLDSRRTVEGVAEELRRVASVSRETSRNWLSVAETELTDARGHASLQMIREALGPEAIVSRGPGGEKCRVCRLHFGTQARPRYYRAGSVPRGIRGAVHPNCRCGAWVAKDRPNLTKSMSVGIEAGQVGWVRRGPDGKCTLLTQSGQWLPLDHHGARATLLMILRLTPLVIPFPLQDGYQFARHGHGRFTEGKFLLVSFSKVATQGVWLPMDPMLRAGCEFRETLMKNSRNTSDYLEGIIKALPSVVEMPEFWVKREVRFLTDFMGYKTLTDWHWVGRPFGKDSWLARYDVGALHPRGAAGILVRKLLRANHMKK